MTRFCTAFRKTFRRINETKDEEVVERHLYLYFYARALYEAVDFFGREMDVDLKVYHGLDEVMYFQKFKTYFNQPMSTTPSKHAARNFAKTSGIILTLISGSEFGTKASKIPKYLPIAWLSDFPNEEELLFYGNNVIFRIHNITESANLKEHTKELLILNKLQKIVQNQSVSWQQESKTTISGLEELITNQNLINKGNKETVQYKIMTKYCQDLFSHFCNHPNTTVIGIDNYMLLPEKIKIALGIANPDDNTKLCLILLINLFQNLIELKLNNLRLEDMLIDKQVYVDAVLNYIRENETFSNNLIRISFQSEPQADRKNSPTLKDLVNKKLQQFVDYKWSIKYIFDETSSLTHSLIFERKHQNINKMKRNPSISLVNVDSVRKCKWSNKLSYFIQITSIDVDYVHIKLIVDTFENKLKRTFRLKEIGQSNLSHYSIDEPIEIDRNTNSKEVAMKIDGKQSKLYHIGLFDPKNADDPLSGCNQIRFKISQDKNRYPPYNNNFKPNTVDISSLFAVQNSSDNTANIYWSAPNDLYGVISYQIVKNIENEETKTNDEIITSLPYAIALSSIPLSFEIITITTVDGTNYQSNPSETIFIYPSSLQIKPWNEYPNLLQILSVDEQEIKIKFTLKQLQPPINKTRYQIQSIDKSEEQLSQLLTIRTSRTVRKDIIINSNTNYRFAIFLNGKQISNAVSVKTSPINFNPNNNYIPQSPPIHSIEKYYDNDKKNICLIWDYPNSVFGDKIVYKIKSSNKIESEEIVYLPYKISNTSNVHIEITTIAIINNKRYEGKTSTKCSVLAREPSQRQLDHVQPETESKYVERLLSVVQQYALLNNNPHTNKELIEFMENTNYEQILNDYTHVISKHNERQKSIKSKCNLYKCSILKRYYFNSDTNTSDHKQEEDFMFYTELLDSIHCYLYHLQDLGQRFSITDQETITGGGDSAA
eukprot:472261_1